MTEKGARKEIIPQVESSLKIWREMHTEETSSEMRRSTVYKRREECEWGTSRADY